MEPEDFNQAPLECHPIQGFVVLLDALGAKTFSRNEIQQFVGSQRLVLRVLDEVMPALKARRSDVGGSSEPSRVLVFGDTIAILWPHAFHQPALWLRELQEFSAAIAYVMALAFISGLQLRGALSVGEFYLEPDIALGAAVADAAEWYEQPQLIGVMATPELKRVLSEMLTRLPGQSQTQSLNDELDELLGELTRLFWPEFELPLKNGSSAHQLYLNWPYAMLTLGPEVTEVTGEHVSKFFQRKLHSRSRPATAQPKYDNTERFFENCFSYIDAAESRSFPLKLQRALTTDVPIRWLSAFLHRYR